MQTQEIEAGSRFGPYTIEGLIAGGGMGSVYAARHSVYGSAVALKILHSDLHRDAEWRARFSREGVVGLELKHPHIVSARDLVMEDDGRVALVLDLVQEGKTLLRVMSREYPEGLPLVQALQILLGLVQGVEYAHDKGVVHGDIKPENVLIHGNFRDAKTWVPALTDFGTVGILAHPVTIDGQPAVVVSPRYASPEHVQGMERLEPRSDIYCLGLLLHYLLTGQHASNAATVQEAATTVVRQVPVAALVDQPEAIVKIFQKATRTAPAERYRTCRDLALAIREALDTLGANLPIEDLAADLVTELIEERRDARKAVWDESKGKTKRKVPASPQDTGDTAVAPEDGDDEPSEDLQDDLEDAPEVPSGDNASESHEAADEASSDPSSEDSELGGKNNGVVGMAEIDGADEANGVEDDDTADDISAFGRPLNADHAAATEVPGEREAHPEALFSTPAPAEAQHPKVAAPAVVIEPERAPMAAWIGGVVAVLVIAAVVAYAVL